MAQKIANKSPLDLQFRKIVGFSIPFSGGAIFNPTYTTKDQIKSNLINYFLTNKSERVFNPFFGGNLRKELFENITEQELTKLKIQFQEDLKLFFPGVKIESLQLTPYPDNNYFVIELKYSLIKFGIEDTITLNIK